MDRNHQFRSRPPDVEEALSSMLWTPYDSISPSDVQTSSDDEDEQLNKKLETNVNHHNNRVSLATISPYVPFRKCDPKLIAAPFWGHKLLEPPSYDSLYCGNASVAPVRTDRLPVLSSLKSLNNNNYSGNVSVTNGNSLLSPSSLASSSSSFMPQATLVAAPRKNHMVYSFSDNFITSDCSTSLSGDGKVCIFCVLYIYRMCDLYLP